MVSSYAFTFGRFQGLHLGHVKMLRVLCSLPTESTEVFISPTTGNLKNPLTWEQRYDSLESVGSWSDELKFHIGLRIVRSPIQVLQDASCYYDRIYCVVGEDRAESIINAVERLKLDSDVHVVPVNRSVYSATAIRQSVIDHDPDYFDQATAYFQQWEQLKNSLRNFLSIAKR